MHALILQFVDPRPADIRPVFSHNLGVMAAILKQRGIDVSLLSLDGYRPEILRKAVIERRPSYILADLPLNSTTVAHRTIVHLAEKFSLPIAVMGQFATCSPTRAASIPGVTALLLGEYERPAADMLTAIHEGRDVENIPGLWFNSADGMIRGPLGMLTDDLDSLPYPDRELFDYATIVAADGEACFKVARGCPMWCAYCPNDWYMDVYADRGPFVRRRSVTNVLDEIDAVIGAYDGIKSVSFYDHVFAADRQWLEQFAVAYPQRFNLPYRCHVRLEHVTSETADLLTGSGCKWVHTHLGSGSNFIREETLSMRLSSTQIVEACGCLRRAGLEVSAEVFVGCPYESQVTIEETLRLVRKSQVGQIHPRMFYPTVATRAAELCAENGWISSRGDEHFWQNKSVLDMPSMPAAQINAVLTQFHKLLNRPEGAGVRKMLRKVTQTRRNGLRRLFGR